MSSSSPAEGHPPTVMISVTEIRRRPGSRMPVERTLVADGLGLSDVSVPDGSPIAFAGELESIHEGVVLTGAAEVPWVGACRRCLKELHGVARIDIREVYETKPTDGETWPLDHDQVDLGPLLHDIALLALPLAPLCTDDCMGPAPEAFPARVEGEAAADDDPGAGEGDEGPAKDPRWAALDDLEL
ncbi:YceD family protein [Aquihabitans sp. McL0605]|uniref:YceD family protein n=1 Tax=Aquihabitans sp. McL0605 TaxID=3415671 RepID=UPI003CEF0F6D